MKIDEFWQVKALRVETDDQRAVLKLCYPENPNQFWLKTTLTVGPDGKPKVELWQLWVRRG